MELVVSVSCLCCWHLYSSGEWLSILQGAVNTEYSCVIAYQPLLLQKQKVAPCVFLDITSLSLCLSIVDHFLSEHCQRRNSTSAYKHAWHPNHTSCSSSGTVLMGYARHFKEYRHTCTHASQFFECAQCADHSFLYHAGRDYGNAEERGNCFCHFVNAEISYVWPIYYLGVLSDLLKLGQEISKFSL
jgi:hypothetical protein